MTEPVAHAGTGRVARLWADDEGTARLAGHLVTRVCTHWDTVGPQTFPRHVNPEPRVQWRAHLDGAGGDEDLYSDDPGAPPLPRDDDAKLEVRGRRLRLEWLEGDEAAAAWERYGW
ncbi:hypothetical protein G8C93_01070 [Cellulosimicrobium cellulans]|uniref:hypothetical protein n=1 Tax=Cellulosimicrobium cellulans TaxID=1710 RepID=UPI001883A133|nr:hypothetical protein [Cellulosimicrobium cellulans]MBE9924482.1 hypothetical protein [Cellulosimicrobium cellulans]